MMVGWGFNSLIGFANELVWLVVGVLAAMWLWNQVKHK
jgi:hypothetical protein